ncbi:MULTISPECIES: hypothetical protein [Rodentibacter]|uniref:Uncharacterized protein n=1 Tax=Rodentibacter pneumotropicus TaxID=758 RepID=A0A4S2PW53_9PAST|nr:MULTISPECIES: hypothetical protein [Pasteurellaceae]TGY50803.1 hypothetical protein E5343_00155 [Pasteurella caecimuris]THA00970.1 hypothetical protein D3M74_06485 [Rodentibacter pneumotropicus]THA08170.1 hypothetical protein D3M78_08125 [Rodentibacter pneumotropicus]THA09139.1 hypothetical protein D3M77_02870 [Rodentibacter pneumotropicus]THA17265.1 hypothetical protein D3M76_01955 [Rodentibacter pneumotropicus]
MATVIFTPAALGIFESQEFYKKREIAQEKLFAYIYFRQKGDDEQAITAFGEFMRCGNEAAEEHQKLLEKHSEWANWRANRK